MSLIRVVRDGFYLYRAYMKSILLQLNIILKVSVPLMLFMLRDFFWLQKKKKKKKKNYKVTCPKNYLNIDSVIIALWK